MLQNLGTFLALRRKAGVRGEFARCGIQNFCRDKLLTLIVLQGNGETVDTGLLPLNLVIN